jgi:hypothetical protein
MRGLMNPRANKSAGWSHDTSTFLLHRRQKESSSFSLPPAALCGIYLYNIGITLWISIGITLRISIYVHSLLSDASARWVGP